MSAARRRGRIASRWRRGATEKVSQRAGVLEDVDVRDNPDQAFSVVHDRDRAHPLIGEDPRRRRRTARPGARRTRRGHHVSDAQRVRAHPCVVRMKRARRDHRRPCGRRDRTGCRRRADRRRRRGDGARCDRPCARRRPAGGRRPRPWSVRGSSACGRCQWAVCDVAWLRSRASDVPCAGARAPAGRRRFRQVFPYDGPERARSARAPGRRRQPPHLMRTEASRAGRSG